MKLKTDIWVRAYLRILDSKCIPAFIVARGDPDLGAVLVKVTNREGNARIMQRGFDLAADMEIWLCVNEGEDADMDAIVGLHRQRDADMWVLEIESPDGIHFLTD